MNLVPFSFSEVEAPNDKKTMQSRVTCTAVNKMLISAQPHLLTNSYLLCHVALVVTQLLKQHSFTNLVMAQPIACLGHQEREMRRNKIDKLATNLIETLDKNYRVLIKKGPVSVETSLKELEEDFESNVKEM